MSLLAEVVVEEWLNRQGYFTIRGIHLGVDEMDLLAIRPKDDGGMECRHVEVQASMRPVSYISRVPKEAQKTGRAANSAKRSRDEIEVGVQEWVDRKFRKQGKVALRESLAPGPWTCELVIHRVKHPDEVSLIREQGVTVLHLSDIVRDLRSPKTPITSASGADLLDLIHNTALDGSE